MFFYREVEIYAPSSEQPPLDRTHDELTPEEKEVDLFFSEKRNVDKLIEYLSLEEKKLPIPLRTYFKKLLNFIILL